MSKPIGLGKKLSDMIHVEELPPEKEHYPDLFISGSDEKRLAEMPDQGEATIRYRVVSRTHREEKGRGYSCDIRLEILSIDPPPTKSKPRKNGNDEARKAFEDYFK